MATGVAKCFSQATGLGFIVPDEGGDDLPANVVAIKVDGFSTLKAGQAVRPDVTTGPKGTHASNIDAARWR